eukprot:489705_1
MTTLRRNNATNIRTHALLLVSGYTRDIERSILSNVIPAPITQLILEYYPKQFTIYGIGKNEYAELGLGEQRSLTSFEKLPRFSDLLHDMKDIYWGSWRFMIKHHPNKIYSVGANDDGDAGVGEKYKDKTNICCFTEMDLSQIDFKDDEFIEIISYGFTAYHSFMVTNYNRILAFGSNGGTRLDPACSDPNFRSPVLSSMNKLFCNIKLKQIHCGNCHSLFVTINGEIYSFGSNYYGECGIPPEVMNPVENPTLVQSLKNVTSLRCGSQHTLCLCNDNELYVFGKNGSSELGMVSETFPALHPFFKNIEVETVDCGDSQSLVIDKTGKCWTFGSNYWGQCGINTNNCVSKPLLFQSHNEYKDVIIDSGSCGYRHTCLLSVDRKIYAFGSNANKEVDPNTQENRIKLPREITRNTIGVDNNYVIEAVYAGDHTTLIIGYQK